MNGGWIFLILLILAILLGGGGYIAYRKFYLKRANALPSYNFPTPAPSGIADKAKELWSKLRNPKTQSGAGYEASGGAGYGPPGAGSRRGGNALDPDEAWDSRVGNEADVYGPGGYYEEQELGLHQPTAYQGPSGGGFRQTETLGAPGGDSQRSRSPAKSTNPFGDDNAASMRSVSPRPHVDAARSGTAAGERRGSADSSPTTERRSIFREDV
jgi:hypothetical protein